MGLHEEVGAKVSFSFPEDQAYGVTSNIEQELRAQWSKWGKQDHPNGTGGPLAALVSQVHRKACDDAFTNGTGGWRDILQEEVSEAFAESDPALLRAELVQVAAVCAQWIMAIDRRVNGA